jgi:cytochrome b561
MPILNNNHTYGLVSIFFHWLMALILIVTFILGLNLEYNFQYYYEVLMLHNSLGILIFLLAIFRACWKWLNIKPDPLHFKKNFYETGIYDSSFFLYFIFSNTDNRVLVDKPSRRYRFAFWQLFARYFRKKYSVQTICS